MNDRPRPRSGHLTNVPTLSSSILNAAMGRLLRHDMGCLTSFFFSWPPRGTNIIHKRYRIRRQCTVLAVLNHPQPHWRVCGISREITFNSLPAEHIVLIRCFPLSLFLDSKYPPDTHVRGRLDSHDTTIPATPDMTNPRSNDRFQRRSIANRKSEKLRLQSRC